MANEKKRQKTQLVSNENKKKTFFIIHFDRFFVIIHKYVDKYINNDNFNNNNDNNNNDNSDVR